MQLLIQAAISTQVLRMQPQCSSNLKQSDFCTMLNGSFFVQCICFMQWLFFFNCLLCILGLNNDWTFIFFHVTWLCCDCELVVSFLHCKRNSQKRLSSVQLRSFPEKRNVLQICVCKLLISFYCLWRNNLKSYERFV